MYYPDELVEEVRARNDIVDIIGTYVSLKKSGSNYFGLCPFHGEKTPSFSVSRPKQMFHCFGCGVGGNVITFLMEYENMTFPEAVRSLAERAGVELPEAEPSEEDRRREGKRQRLLKVLKEAAGYYYRYLRSPEGHIGMEYFKKRGLGAEVMHSFGLGYAGKGGVYRYLKERGYSEEDMRESGLIKSDERYGNTDRFWNRVMFPIMDLSNKVIGFGGRVMGEGEPKYLNSPETLVFDKGRNLYGLNQARRSRKGYLIACEGYMDVISMHQAGFTEAVASLGTAFTDSHAVLLKRYTDEVRLVYDSDGAGVRAALRAIPILKRAGISSRVVNLEPYKDPDEFIKNRGRDEFQKRLDAAENSFYFEIRQLEKDYELSDPEGRTRFIEAMAERIARIDNEIERDNYTAAFAGKYLIDNDSLKRAVALAGVSVSKGEERYGDATGLPHTPSTGKEPSLAAKVINDEEGVNRAEIMLLTMLADDPQLMEPISRYVRASDFSEGMIRRTAELMYDAIDKGKPVASIVNNFEDAEEQRAVSAIVNGEVPPIDTNEEKEKALTDFVVKILENSAKKASESRTGEDPVARNIALKRAIGKLKAIRISLKS
ncbi:MAG: DNA primase [Lachnospiraceae bacterium]|nr:DNA primase [Lachnospiraceae bacterium]